MTLAVVGTLSTNNNRINKRKQKQHLFQHDVLRDNKYGNGFWVNVIELEAQKWVPGIKKETRHCRIRRHQIDQIKTKELFQQEIPT